MSVRSPRNPLDFEGVWDAIVIGGGFYGCSIATALRTDFGYSNVLVVEREQDLFRRASLGNQARVHNGYHYPRSFTTAFRSHVNFPRFVDRYRDCIDDSFISLYCIAALNSQVTTHQFQNFCQQFGGASREVSDSLRDLFNPRLINSVHEVTEFAFDANRLTARLQEEMEAANVGLLLGTTVCNIKRDGDETVVALNTGEGAVAHRAMQVFNCTYAGLNHVCPGFGAVRARLKYEISEIALIEVPPSLAGVGVTVIDGPFFSCMPFPMTAYHTLSHVRYTPHISWVDQDDAARHPYEILAEYPKKSQARYMIADACRYLPLLNDARYERSIFEVKAVLLSNEVDDGRPILFERHRSLPGTFSILGGKIDNIFDVFDAMEQTLGEARPPNYDAGNLGISKFEVSTGERSK